MNIFITGGTGFIGKPLSVALSGKGHRVYVLTRSSKNPAHDNNITHVDGDPAIKGPWLEKLMECDVVINLAGASIFKRWTPAYKETLIKSRIDTTRNIVEEIARHKKSDLLLISASAVGYYGFHDDELLDENAAPGNDFLSSLSKEWEMVALKALSYVARVILNRFGIVLGKGGGAIHMMLPLFRYWLGSQLGNGRQYFSWIHLYDLVNIFIYQIENRGLSGIYNCTAPNPVTNRELTRAIASIMKKPLIMPPVPGVMLKLVMGDFADTLLKGQRVIPKRLLNEGYSFKFQEINQALDDILL
ncbi:MAG: TIGR01777 family oxidoreductase [Deltaproteobacteria bacterium]|nr:TIGR01777 family oxidoreductase [Deltaproteobacteria bacterium]